MANKKLTNLKKEIEGFTPLSEIDYILVQPRYEGEWLEVDKEWFLANIGRIDYDAGYGGEVIATLNVVLKDGSWLERETYDGAEGFVHKYKPVKTGKKAKLDLGVLFHDRHGVPFNATKIDGKLLKVPGSKVLSRESYDIWYEKDGKIVLESHKYDKGDYKPEHKEIM